VHDEARICTTSDAVSLDTAPVFLRIHLQQLRSYERHREDVVRFSTEPLPGDIIVYPCCDDHSPWPQHTFELTRWPTTDVRVGGPYQSFASALQHAKKLAALTGHHVWRPDTRSLGPDARFEDVTNN